MKAALICSLLKSDVYIFLFRFRLVSESENKNIYAHFTAAINPEFEAKEVETLRVQRWCRKKCGKQLQPSSIDTGCFVGWFRTAFFGQVRAKSRCSIIHLSSTIGRCEKFSFSVINFALTINLLYGFLQLVLWCSRRSRERAFMTTTGQRY